MSEQNRDHWEEDYRMARRAAWLVDGRPPSLEADKVFGPGGVGALADTLLRALKETEAEPASKRRQLAWFGYVRLLDAFLANPAIRRGEGPDGDLPFDRLWPRAPEERDPRLYCFYQMVAPAQTRSEAIRLAALACQLTDGDDAERFSECLKKLAETAFDRFLTLRREAVEPLTRAKLALNEAKSSIGKAWQSRELRELLGHSSPECLGEWKAISNAQVEIGGALELITLEATGVLYASGTKLRNDGLNECFAELHGAGVEYALLAFLTATEPDSWGHAMPGRDAMRQRVKNGKATLKAWPKAAASTAGGVES